MAQTPPDAKTQKANLLKAELFIAIRNNDPAAVKTTLAQGGDTNARNWLDFTPLMWAASRGNQEIVEMLLSHGAKLDASSTYGSALTFAALGRQEKLALYLLKKGAAPNPERADGATPLMLAAANGHTNLMARLLQKSCDPNQKDHDGATALIYAARLGQTAAAGMLLKAGAEVDAADSQGRTALLYAAANGHPKMADVLLAHHASINHKDRRNATALLLAARYSGDPAIVRSLLKSGADTSVQDDTGRTPLSLAMARGYEDVTNALHEMGAKATPASVRPTLAMEPLNINKAVANSLTVLQSGLKSFSEKASCTSCHHQGLGLMALGLAVQRGFSVDKELVGTSLKHLGEEGQQNAPYIHQALQDPNVAKMIPAVDINDFSIGAGYIFGGLIANQVPANPGLAETALFLAKQQTPEGRWGFGFMREPIQSSSLTTTALALHVLRTYGPQEKLTANFERAKQWLLTTSAPNAEDKASRLLGLKWAGGSEAQLEKSRRDLLAAQRPDGGWSQLPTLHSDAYATGLALYALSVGGSLPTSDPAYQRGVQYLLRTQDEDGSWYVNKRTTPANTYFNAGFPGGESQYISFGATCWATMALLEASGQTQTARR